MTDIPNSRPFAKGDVVRLNSGGPKMTVHSLSGQKLSCQWFDRNGKKHTSEFDAQMVSHFVPAPPAW
jgi:uncharacterized protein YodC (DUF2158 family)